jgi:hypothetical protein
MKAAIYLIIASVLLIAIGMQYLYFAPQVGPAPVPAPVLPGPIAPGSFPAAGESELPDSDYCSDDEPCIVSLRQVLQNAARYDGRRVLAFGVLRAEDVGTSLYVDPAAYAAGQREASVQLRLTRPGQAPDGWALAEQEGRSVLVEGRFSGDGAAGYAGAIYDIALVRRGSFFQ